MLKDTESSLRLPVYGMTCQKCVARVTQLIAAHPEVDRVSVSLDEKCAEISPVISPINLEIIKADLEQAGFSTVSGLPEDVSAETANLPSVSVQAGEVDELRFSIRGMSCASCAATIERKLNALPGIESAVVNLAGNFAQVGYQPDRISADQVYAAVDAAGFQAVADDNEDYDESRTQLRLVMIAAAGAVPIMLLMFWPVFGPATVYLNALLATLVQWTAGLGFYLGAFKSLRNRSANMDVLVALGITAAYGYSLLSLTGILGVDAALFFETSAMLILFILFGKWLESRAKGRAGAALRALLKLQADSATLLVDGQERVVPVSQVRSGDLVLVRPGDKIPIDGEVVSGESAVNEAMISGESVPVNKTVGSQVIGATLNETGRLLVRATHVGEDAVLARIVRMVETAQGDKPPIQRLADRISAFFVPLVVVLSLVTLCGWLLTGASFVFAFQMAVAVVVVACPCALGLATPTAIMVGSSVGLEQGILFKKASALEGIAQLKILLLDKTGTLTQGRFVVEQVCVAGGMTEDSFLEIVAGVESASRHPLARGVVDELERRGLKPATIDHVDEIGGFGLRGFVADKTILCGNEALMERFGIEMNTAIQIHLERVAGAPSFIYVAIDGKQIGALALSDALKENAQQMVAQLKRLKVDPVLISGDRYQVAQAVAHQLGIASFEAEVLPEQKLDTVKAYQQRNHAVGMVGDGINDAPALAQANVGIAIGSGMDVARETGDLVLVGDDLLDIVRGIVLGRLTLNKIKQNLFWAFFYNLLGLPLAAGLFYPLFGLYLKPEYAGLAMAFSSVSVVTNSLLLRRAKQRLERI